MLKTLIKLQFQKALARYTANSSNKKKNGKKSSFNSPAVYLALLAFVGVVFAFMFYNMFSMMAHRDSVGCIFSMLWVRRL